MIIREYQVEAEILLEKLSAHIVVADVSQGPDGPIIDLGFDKKAIDVVREALLSAQDDGARNPYC